LTDHGPAISVIFSSAWGHHSSRSETYPYISADGNVAYFNFNNSGVPSGSMNVHLNLWLYKDRRPAYDDRDALEIIISDVIIN